jgi:hypothetical protein
VRVTAAAGLRCGSLREVVQIRLPHCIETAKKDHPNGSIIRKHAHHLQGTEEHGPVGRCALFHDLGMRLKSKESNRKGSSRYLLQFEKIDRHAAGQFLRCGTSSGRMQ